MRRALRREGSKGDVVCGGVVTGGKVRRARWAVCARVTRRVNGGAVGVWWKWWSRAVVAVSVRVRAERKGGERDGWRV